MLRYARHNGDQMQVAVVYKVVYKNKIPKETNPAQFDKINEEARQYKADQKLL